MSRNAPVHCRSSRRLQIFLGLASLLLFAGISSAQLFSTYPSTNRARVVIVESAAATATYSAQPEVIRVMVGAGVTKLTGSNNVADAWAGLFSPKDVVGIKVLAAPGPTCGTRPAVVAAVVSGLLAAKVPADHIVIWDRRLSDLRRAGYAQLAAEYGVRLAGSVDAGWDEKTFYESPLLGNLRWGDHEFGITNELVGRKSFVSKLVSQEITKHISIAPLMNENTAAVAGHLYSLAFGSTDNLARFADDPERMAAAVPEIYALPAIGDRAVLHITDALLCQYAGGAEGKLHYSAVLNQLRFSRDPVALDVLSVEELERQRTLAKFAAEKLNTELFHNATLLQFGVSDPKKIQVENVR